MSDFLIDLKQSPSSRDLVGLMQMPYSHRHPEGKQLSFPWGRVGILQERFGQNLFQSNGTLVAFVGDPVNKISQGFIESLIDHVFKLRRQPASTASIPAGSILDQFNGSFAFLVADASGLSVITDPMNYVQVYAASDEHGRIVSLGTHPDLVASVGGGARELDFTSIGEFLNAGTPLFPNTIYRHVKELNPGTIYNITVSQNGQSIKRHTYWSPPYEHRNGYKEDSLAEELRDILLTIVRERAQVSKAGVFLSGGLDSRLIMAAVPESVGCVGLTFSNHPNRETRIAQKVAKCYRRDWTLLRRNPEYLADCLVDSVKLTGCEYEWTCGQVIGVAPELAELNLDVVLEGTLFNDYFTAYCARDWQPRKRFAGLLPTRYEKSDWSYADQISSFWKQHLKPDLLAQMSERRRLTYEKFADPKRGSVAEWMEIYPFTQDPTVGYYPAERRTLPVRLVAMDRRALDFSFRCPIELKLGSRLYKKAACSIYGKGNEIPNANDGVRPASGHWSRLTQRTIHEASRKVGRIRAQLNGGEHVQHSWHNYQQYWRESPRLKQLCQEYGPNLDEFNGSFLAEDGRKLLNNPELHWEYGFRLLQLAVWRQIIRSYSSK